MTIEDITSLTDEENLRQEEWYRPQHILFHECVHCDSSNPKHNLKKAWLGWKDSNLRMTGPKPVALPLGYTPLLCDIARNPVFLQPGTGMRYQRLRMKESDQGRTGTREGHCRRPLFQEGFFERS